MILAALLLLQVVTPAEPADEVVVAAQKLGRLRISTHKDRKTGVVSCRFKRRSGDPELDAGVCKAMLECAPKVRTRAEIQACMDAPIKALLPKMKWEK